MRDLRSLLTASGVTPVTGSDFRADVPGAANGIDMLDYLITSVAFSGEPTSDVPGGFNDNELIAVSATFVRGSQAWRIQQNTSAGWSFDDPGGNASVTIVSVTPTGSPSGAGHTLSLRLRGRLSGSPSVFATWSQPDFVSDSNPHYVRFSASASGGTAGQSLVSMDVTYNPDIGNFNPDLQDVWSYNIDNRTYTTSSLEYQWRTAASGGGTLVSTLAAFDLTNSALYPTDPEGLLPGEELALYLRYRTVGSGTWTNYPTAINAQDPRPPE